MFSGPKSSKKGSYLNNGLWSTVIKNGGLSPACDVEGGVVSVTKYRRPGNTYIDETIYPCTIYYLNAALNRVSEAILAAHAMYLFQC